MAANETEEFTHSLLLRNDYKRRFAIMTYQRAERVRDVINVRLIDTEGSSCKADWSDKITEP